jgi:hypothetical protein
MHSSIWTSSQLQVTSSPSQAQNKVDVKSDIRLRTGRAFPPALGWLSPRCLYTKGGIEDERWHGTENDLSSGSWRACCPRSSSAEQRSRKMEVGVEMLERWCSEVQSRLAREPDEAQIDAWCREKGIYLKDLERCGTNVHQREHVPCRPWHGN